MIRFPVPSGSKISLKSSHHRPSDKGLRFIRTARRRRTKGSSSSERYFNTAKDEKHPRALRPQSGSMISSKSSHHRPSKNPEQFFEEPRCFDRTYQRSSISERFFKYHADEKRCQDVRFPENSTEPRPETWIYAVYLPGSEPVFCRTSPAVGDFFSISSMLPLRYPSRSSVT